MTSSRQGKCPMELAWLGQFKRPLRLDPGLYSEAQRLAVLGLLPWDSPVFYGEPRADFLADLKQRHGAAVESGETVAHLPDCPCGPCSSCRPAEYAA